MKYRGGMKRRIACRPKKATIQGVVLSGNNNINYFYFEQTFSRQFKVEIQLQNLSNKFIIRACTRGDYGRPPPYSQREKLAMFIFHNIVLIAYFILLFRGELKLVDLLPRLLLLVSVLFARHGVHEDNIISEFFYFFCMTLTIA